MKAAWKMSAGPGCIDGIDAEFGGVMAGACHPGQDTVSPRLRRSGETETFPGAGAGIVFRSGSALGRTGAVRAGE